MYGTCFVRGDTARELLYVVVDQEKIAEAAANVVKENVNVRLQRQIVLQQNTRGIAIKHICSGAKEILACLTHTLV